MSIKIMGGDLSEQNLPKFEAGEPKHITARLGRVAFSVVMLVVLIFVLMGSYIWPGNGSSVAWLWAIIITLFVFVGSLALVILAPREHQTKEQAVEFQARLLTVGVLIFVLVIFILGAILLMYFGGEKRPDLIAILLTGATATIAIIWQIHEESRKQLSERASLRAEQEKEEHRRRLDFTHERIQEFRSDREVQEHKANLRRFYPAGYRIPKNDVPRLFAKSIDPIFLNATGAKALHAPIWTSINDLMSFYEQLASDVYRQAVANGEEKPETTDRAKEKSLPGSVDEQLLQDVLSGALIATFKTTLTVIEAHWRDDPEVFERIRWLVNRWQFPLPLKERDFKNAVDPKEWKANIWSEYGADRIYGVDYPLTHDSKNSGSWHDKTYRDLALKGLKTWPKSEPIKELASKIKKMYPADVSRINAILKKRTNPVRTSKVSANEKSYS